MREQFLKGISEAERKGKMLKEEQKQMKENVALASKQVRIVFLIFLGSQMIMEMGYLMDYFLMLQLFNFLVSGLE